MRGVWGYSAVAAVAALVLVPYLVSKGQIGPPANLPIAPRSVASGGEERPSLSSGAMPEAGRLPREAVEGGIILDNGVRHADDGTVIVLVRQHMGNKLKGVRVLANGAPIGVTDQDGIVTARLRAGRITIALDSASIPPHLMFAIEARPADPSTSPRPPGVFAPTIDVHPGAATDLAIDLFRKTSIVGSVVRITNEPIGGAFVRLQAMTPGLESVCRDTHTGQDGLYQFEGIAPGSYVIKAFTSGLGLEDIGVSPNPMAVPIMVEEGGSLVMSPMVAGDKSCKIVGRILSSDGVPVAGIEVIVCPKGPAGPKVYDITNILIKATSIEDGSFEALVPGGDMAVWVHAEGAGLPFGASHRIRKPLAPFDLRLTRGGTADLGNIVLEFAKFLRVNLSIEDNLEAIRLADPTLPSVGVPEVFWVATEELGSAKLWRRVRMKDGKAKIELDAPRSEVTVIVRRRGHVPLRYPIVGKPGDVEVNLRYP